MICWCYGDNKLLISTDEAAFDECAWSELKLTQSASKDNSNEIVEWRVQLTYNESAWLVVANEGEDFFICDIWHLISICEAIQRYFS